MESCSLIENEPEVQNELKQHTSPKVLEDSYYHFVNYCAVTKCNTDIPNGSAEHARHLISKFLENASKKVTIFSGRLSLANDSGKIDIYAWNELIQSALHFLSKEGTSLEIITEEDISSSVNEHPFINSIKSFSDAKGKLKIYTLNPNLRNTIDVHFLSADDIGYRVEYDRKNREAIANFNSPENAERLTRIFQQLKASATPVNI